MSSRCPQCGADIEGLSGCQELYHELAFYTLAHPDMARFVHQHAVDAYAAQHPDERDKPIKVAFALVGLYLLVEEGRTGREIQREHMRLGQLRRSWPVLPPPLVPATRSVADVLAVQPGATRDVMLRAWAGSVWETWRAHREQIRDWISR